MLGRGEHKNVLIVDDDKLTRAMLMQKLHAFECNVCEASSGGEALAVLRDRTMVPDVIVLDRMMDDMDGLEVLRQIKAMPDCVNVPVVMLTSLETEEDIRLGIEAGVYQYLIKPVNVELFLSSIHNAFHEGAYIQELVTDLHANEQSLGLMKESYFEFRTPEEARNLALLLATCYPDPKTVLVGLMELMMNAVEHGNLGISYDEKRQLLKERKLEQEINRRLELPHFMARVASVKFTRTLTEIHLSIIDEGEGFDWKGFMDNHNRQKNGFNGRGIGLAKYVSFDEMDYSGVGNEVHTIVRF